MRDKARQLGNMIIMSQNGNQLKNEELNHKLESYDSAYNPKVYQILSSNPLTTRYGHKAISNLFTKSFNYNPKIMKCFNYGSKVIQSFHQSSIYDPKGYQILSSSLLTMGP
jgi:hypothetical protein